jgi:hypothetical protein
MAARKPKAKPEPEPLTVPYKPTWMCVECGATGDGDGSEHAGDHGAA